MLTFNQFINEDADLDTKLKKLGLKRGGAGYPIGKVIGGEVYVHRNYENQFPPEELKKAKEIYAKEFPDKQYQVVKYNPKTGTFSFIFSSDFDTNPEPSVEGGLTVKADGTAKKFPNAGWIYHHKWAWVADDYKGFDVEKEKQRSLKWSSMEGVDKARIGQRKHWDANVIPRLQEEQEAPDILYHVTAAENVPKIMKNGIIPNKSKLGFTRGAMGQKLSKKGYIYAFETFHDALRWLHKATWDVNHMKDYSVFRILKFNDNKNEYEEDTHWESVGGAGRWLMKAGQISPEAITLLPPIKPETGKLLTKMGKYAKEEDAFENE